MNQPITSQPSADERNWAVLCHLAALLGLIIWGLGLVLGPLIAWLAKRETMPFVDEQGKEALNFQITVFLAGLVCSSMIFLLIGIPLLVLLGIFDFVSIVLAAVKVSRGESFRYPISLRLIR